MSSKIGFTTKDTQLNFDGKNFKGDAQVLSGFFEYHNGNTNPSPVSSECEDDMTYYYATINVGAISYIVKQLSFNQVQDII